MIPLLSLAALLQLAAHSTAATFTVAGGQIFTPGFAVVNAPQPGTPLGGETLHVSLDVTANGKLDLPPYVAESPSQIRNITIFLFSYQTGRNFTVASTDIMGQEPGSTVKHINWVWPDCLVGDGQPKTLDSDRGVYNISIRQNFRLNGRDHYTIFDLPIAVTNSIPSSNARPSCDGLNNNMMAPEQINLSAANSVGVLFAPGDATQVDKSVPGRTGNGNSGNNDNGIGGSKPEAKPGDGLGSTGSRSWRSGTHWLWLMSMSAAFIL